MTDIQRDARIDETTLVALIQRAQQHADPEAFDGLYLLYADRIYRYLTVRLGNTGAAEEVTAQVFLRLIEKIHQYQIAPKDNAAIFTAWFYRLAHNKMIDVLRRQKQRRHVPISVAEMMPSGQSMSEAVEERIDFEHVLEKLQLLNEQQRQVILLRFVEGFSIAETAQIMEKTEGAVKALQHRSLESLRRHLSRE
ncbi:MAG: sigma-70 family RNA polymerase sigma factor [Caldilineaceae bacterium]|nr:sigma-70 family RNA polymerase sigma factor [Caldilineaceae bacterium]